MKYNYYLMEDPFKKDGQGEGQGRKVQALHEGAGKAAKPGSVWPRNTNRLLHQLSNKRCSWQDYPATGGGG